ncbi:MAG TPA: GNAT family N-acetyltransferase [Candidatus Acidoferrum sp.]|nr:GNAT family N-acetyltransferase [Candidatus Acidoferrum sp.]
MTGSAAHHGQAGGPPRRGTQETDIRPARPDELETCAQVWRVAINDYIARLAQPELPDDVSNLTGLYVHLQATDPDRFLVATRPDSDAPGGERIVGFASAIVRGRLWFLSMLFILPEEQGLGLGRALLTRVLPPPDAGMSLGTATDSAQPISNALYSMYGIVPRVPFLHLIGDVRVPDALPDLPAGVTAIPFEAIAGGQPDGAGHRELTETVGRVDLAAAGFEHPQDHRFLRTGGGGRRGFLYRDAAGRPVAYGYTSDVGRVGPVAALDSSHVAPILAHLLRAAQPRGAFAVWVPGTAGESVTMLLGAGLRLESFPLLLCWDRPVSDLTRYLPISPGLL